MQKMTFSPDTMVNLSDLFDLSALAPGFHFLYARAKDSRGNWGQTYTRPLLVVENINPSLTELEYFFDEDPGFGNGTPIAFDAVAMKDTNLVIPLNDLEDGTRTLYIRGMDNNGNWSVTNTKLFMVTTVLPRPGITRLEYFFDKDPGYGKGYSLAVPLDSNVTVKAVIPLDSLKNGLHFLYTRALDEYGNYGLTHLRPILVLKGTMDPLVTGFEYFLDKDPGVGKATFVPLANVKKQEYAFTVDLSFEKPGLHFLGMRPKDSNGEWGYTMKRMFFVTKTTGEPQITEIEYFIDKDPGFGKATSLDKPGKTSLDTSFTIGLGPMEINSVHKIYIRAKDENGNWSLAAVREFIYKEFVEQNIPLTKGWNIVSFYVKPKDTNMLAVVQPLIDEGSLVKMMDERGAAIEKIDTSWINTINYLVNEEGYHLKVDTNTDLSVTGLNLDYPYPVNLSQGWNIMGYPSDNAALVADVLSPVVNAGNLRKMMDETGASYEDVYPIGWVDNIQQLDAGEGYQVKLYYNDWLKIQNQGLKSSTQPNPDKRIEPVHFVPGWPGNGLNHMTIHVPLDEIKGLEAGDEIAIFAGQLCVGISVYNGIKTGYLSLAATADDPMTLEKDGFTANDTMAFRIWDKSRETEISNIRSLPAEGYTKYFKQKGTAVVFLNHLMESTGITANGGLHDFIGVYPNPLHEKAEVSLQLNQPRSVSLQVLDIHGKHVQTLFKGILDKGGHSIRWDAGAISPGFYILKMHSPDHVKTLRVVVK